MAAFVVGAIVGRLIPHSGGKSGSTGEGASRSLAGKAAPSLKPPKPAAPAPPPVVMVDGFQYEAMDFDTSPDFTHPSTLFPKPVKVYFRIRLKDMRTAPGTKKRAAISYRRLGKTEKENGPMRQLTEEDLTHVGKTNEVLAYKPGLTFMASPPVGQTSFQIYVNAQPLAKASFTVNPPAKANSGP